MGNAPERLSKGERTRERIIAEVAPIFNQKGYFGASMADILEVTGLQKGGVYRHFESKEDLALAAFDYAFHLYHEHLKAALNRINSPKEKLVAVLDELCGLAESPLIPGGCPLLNTGIESDDTHPVLRQRAQEAMTMWRNELRGIILLGKRMGEINASVNAEAFTTVFIATVEGSIFLAKLYDNPAFMVQALGHLKGMIREQL